MLSFDDIKTAFIRNGYTVNLSLFYMNLFGIRGYDNTGWHENRVDFYNDTIGFFFTDEYRNQNLLLFKGTTDTGLKYLKAPINNDGTAILKEGQYQDGYKIGLHKGYNALIQNTPVSVYRDNNKNSQLDYDDLTTQVGFFGINIHKSDGSGVISGYSAGCQVFESVEDFNIMMSFAERHSKLYKTFNYTLFNADSFKI
jgi:hypothetical protein